MSRRLAAQAEAVCRAYLPYGRRSGHYWIAGDVQGTSGKSLFVKLSGDGAGRWTDAASGEFGDSRGAPGRASGQIGPFWGSLGPLAKVARPTFGKIFRRSGEVR
jgi:hypothetical protein